MKIPVLATWDIRSKTRALTVMLENLSSPVVCVDSKENELTE